MNICLFGGTFDPIHLGHVAIATMAAERYELKQVRFCPAYRTPFKQDQQPVAYAHRFAMIALAVQQDARFVVSDLESSDVTGGTGPNYTIDTVHRLQSSLGKSDRLFFLCGADTFQHIAKWKEPVALLRNCEFIVAARPGYRIADLAAALPEELRPGSSVLKAGRQLESETLVLSDVNIHLMSDASERSSSTRVRHAVKAHQPVKTQLDSSVAAYIKKHGLYRTKKQPGKSEALVIDSSQVKRKKRVE